jgi:predicted ArsR family transcriptional regulator
VDRSWDAAVQAVAVLEEPTRRRLYEYVAGREAPVSRDDAAAALGIPRTTAAFHLDRLTGEGLLDTCYERRSGRTGPGAGRPAKLYHRSDREIEITLPERQYAVIGHLLAAAIQDAETTGVTPREAVNQRAKQYGETLAGTAVADAAVPRDGGGAGAAMGGTGGAGTDTGDTGGATGGAGGAGTDTSDTGGAGGAGTDTGGAGADRGELLVRVLEAHGFEPRVEADGIVLGNCPFRRLAMEHPRLVCGLNLHLVAGLLASLEAPLQAGLAATPGRCCVRITGRAPLTKPTEDAPPADA